MKIKWYTIVSTVLFFIALLLIIVTFVFVSTYKDTSTEANPPAALAPQNEASSVSTSTTEDSAGTKSISEIGIPLKTLPLTPAQRDALKTAQIDIETFVITPPMVECGQRTLGPNRFDDIVAGSAPTFFEIITLTPCLTAG